MVHSHITDDAEDTYGQNAHPKNYCLFVFDLFVRFM